MTGKAGVTDDLPGALHRALRTATRSDHVEVDRFVGRLNFHSRKEYGCFLNLHYCALHNLSGDWRAEDSEDFSGMLKCLQSDLQALGTMRAKIQPVTRHPLVFANRLGVGYVVRSTRLGANLQRGRVAHHFPASFLEWVPTLSWTHFLQQLELETDASRAGARDEVLRGARVAWELFVGLLRQTTH